MNECSTNLLLLPLNHSIVQTQPMQAKTLVFLQIASLLQWEADDQKIPKILSHLIPSHQHCRFFNFVDVSNKWHNVDNCTIILAHVCGLRRSQKQHLNGDQIIKSISCDSTLGNVVVLNENDTGNHRRDWIAAPKKKKGSRKCLFLCLHTRNKASSVSTCHWVTWFNSCNELRSGCQHWCCTSSDMWKDVKH